MSLHGDVLIKKDRSFHVMPFFFIILACIVCVCKLISRVLIELCPHACSALFNMQLVFQYVVNCVNVLAITTCTVFTMALGFSDVSTTVLVWRVGIISANFSTLLYL